MSRCGGSLDDDALREAEIKGTSVSVYCGTPIIEGVCCGCGPIMFFEVYFVEIGFSKKAPLVPSSSSSSSSGWPTRDICGMPSSPL